VIDLCTDRVSLAHTAGVQRSARLLGMCRADCLTPTLSSMPFVGKRPDWSHPRTAETSQCLKHCPKDGLESVGRLRCSYIMQPFCKAERSSIRCLTALPFSPVASLHEQPDPFENDSSFYICVSGKRLTLTVSKSDRCRTRNTSIMFFRVASKSSILNG
jgi:hypothetical protein